MSNLILTGSLLGWVGSKINTAVQSFFLWIDSVVYWFASSCYQLFIKLSTAEIFSDSFFSNFANRIYAILGIFMLFYLAYALLNAIIDPDKLTKGDKSVSKLASNFVVSLVIIGLLPTIFSYAYNLQNFILSENVIGTLVFGTKATANEDGMVQFGDALSFTVLNTFINPQNYNVLIADDYTWFNLKQDIIENNEYGALNGLADAIVNGANVVEENGTSSETVYVEYKVILSTLVGVYLCYIMISFCLDLGVRLVKLAFCQLIAPIPVIMRAMPSKKGTFDKWLKLTLSVYFEVFVRVGIIYLSVYFINEIVSNNELMNVFSYSGGGIQGMLALVIIILGILTFAKQAPKMISDMLGIDTGNLKLGIGEKIKGNFLGKTMVGVGARAAGAVTGSIGAGVAGLANGAGFAGFGFGLVNGWKNKGMQFGRQQRDMYSKLTGDYKGKPGLFGGPSLGTRATNYITGMPSEVAKKNRDEQMKTFEDQILSRRKSEIEEREAIRKRRFDEQEQIRKNNFEVEQEKRKEAFEAKRDSDVKEMLEKLEQLKTSFEENKAVELKALNDQLTVDVNSFNLHKSQRLQELKLSLEKATREQNVTEMSKIKNEIKATEASTFDQTEHDRKVQAINGRTFESTPEAIQLTEQIHQRQSEQYVPEQFVTKKYEPTEVYDEAELRAQMQKEYNKDLDKLDDVNRAKRRDRLVDSASKKYHANVVASDRLGEERANKQQKEAFEKVLKDLGYKKEEKK